MRNKGRLGQVYGGQKRAIGERLVAAAEWRAVCLRFPAGFPGQMLNCHQLIPSSWQFRMDGLCRSERENRHWAQQLSQVARNARECRRMDPTSF
jgi:hypothetical protein